MDVKNNKVDANGKKRKYIYESRYQQIAVELAQKIADGWYTIGEKISARSTLAIPPLLSYPTISASISTARIWANPSAS